MHTRASRSQFVLWCITLYYIIAIIPSRMSAFWNYYVHVPSEAQGVDANHSNLGMWIVAQGMSDEKVDFPFCVSISIAT